MAGRTNRTLSRVLVAGAAGGTMEVLWIGLVAMVFGIQASQVARGVAATLVPVSATSAIAPWFGLAIHFVLSLALAFVFARVVADRLRGSALIIAAVTTLAAVWVFNFFVLLPAINPAFALMLPYPVTLVSKLLFGLAMALVLDRENGRSATT